jgi:hypothetical protein
LTASGEWRPDYSSGDRTFIAEHHQPYGRSGAYGGSIAPLREEPATPTVDELKRRIEEAARYLPLEQLAISPQCGFASSVSGNLIGEDDQQRKLETIVQAARQVWG